MKLDHVNLTVTNLATSIDWYRRVFGFEPVERGVYRTRPWAILRAGDALLAIYETAGREVPSGEQLARLGHHRVAHVGLRITDERAWLETVARERVNVDHVAEYPHSKSWYIVDPSGWELEVVLWNDDVVRFPAAA